jgi:hypothetical protein
MRENRKVPVLSLGGPSWALPNANPKHSRFSEKDNVMNPLFTWALIAFMAITCILAFGCERQRPIVVPETEQGE